MSRMMPVNVETFYPYVDNTRGILFPMLKWGELDKQDMYVYIYIFEYMCICTTYMYIL